MSRKELLMFRAQSKVLQNIAEFEEYMEKNGGYYSDWYVGITDNPQKRLFQDHNVKEKNDQWLFQHCGSASDAAEVVKYFLKKGCDGKSGGGDYNTTYAYAYKKNSRTKP